AAEDAAGVVDFGNVVRPLELVVWWIRIAQRCVVEEEAAAHAVVVRDRHGHVVGLALAERAVGLGTHAGDDGVVVNGVAGLVIDDVGDAAGVAAVELPRRVHAGAKEVRVVAVGVGVAGLIDVDLRARAAVGPRERGIHAFDPALGRLGGDER